MPKVIVSLRSICLIKWTEFYNFRHFRSLLILAHLLLLVTLPVMIHPRRPIEIGSNGFDENNPRNVLF